jgi:hypothetical protein
MSDPQFWQGVITNFIISLSTPFIISLVMFLFLRYSVKKYGFKETGSMKALVVMVIFFFLLVLLGALLLPQDALGVPAIESMAPYTVSVFDLVVKLNPFLSLFYYPLMIVLFVLLIKQFYKETWKKTSALSMVSLVPFFIWIICDLLGLNF